MRVAGRTQGNVHRGIPASRRDSAQRDPFPFVRMSRASQGLVAVAVIATLSLVGVADASAQWAYDRGQNVVPVFEGWEANPDGTFSMVFGFFNRNCHETLHVPVGPDNSIEPGGPDQGQPTRFFPRRAEFVFKVPVPADFGDKELVWTLTAHGKTEKAYASLRPEYVLDRQITMMNEASYGQRVGESDNQYPEVELEGSPERTVRVGEPLGLTARVRDDGLPKPRPDRRHVGQLLAGWLVYRGDEAHVTFEPPQFNPDLRRRVSASPLCQGIEPVPEWATSLLSEDGTLSVTATFSRPGVYVLRALAHDIALKTAREVTVTVTE